MIITMIISHWLATDLWPMLVQLQLIHIYDSHGIAARECMQSDEITSKYLKNKKALRVQERSCKLQIYHITTSGSKIWYRNIKFSWHWSWNKNNSRSTTWSTHTQCKRCDYRRTNNRRRVWPTTFKLSVDRFDRPISKAYWLSEKLCLKDSPELIKLLES